MSEPKDIPIIPGDTRILLIAPHGKKTDPKDDINTDKITREVAETLKCSWIVNDVIKRADRDYNEISHASKDEKFIRGIEAVVKADGPTLVIWIHGADDKKIYEEAKLSNFEGKPEDLHALIGYGQGSIPQFTAKKETVERLRDLLTQHGMNSILTRDKARNYRGRNPHKMNQWFLKEKYKLDQVQSIQLEIRKTGFRDKNAILKTARIISSALNELIPPAPKIADKPIAEQGKDLVQIVSKPILGIEEKADDALVQKVYSWLEDRFKKHVADFMLEAGKHIIKEFYNNDPQKVLDKKPVRDKSLSLLIKELKQSSGDAPSRSWFFDAVSLAAHEMIFKKQGVQTFGQLGHSQKLLLLHVPEWKEKERLAEDALKAKYTVRDFKDHIKSEMDRIKAETGTNKKPGTEQQDNTKQKAKLTETLNEFSELIKQYEPVPISVTKFLSYLKRSIKASPTSAVQNLKINRIRWLRFKSGDFLHYILNYLGSVGQKYFHSLEKNLQFF